MDLSSEDLMLANKLTLSLYASLDPEAQIQAMLQALQVAVPCDVVAWNQFDTQTLALKMVTLPIPPEDDLPDIQAIGRFAHQSPFPAYHAASHDKSWRMITDFMPIEDFQQTDFVRQGLRNWGPHQMSCVLTSFDQQVNAMTLNRKTRAFSERDRSMLNLLYPHLRLSHHNAHIFDKARHSLSELQTVVESAPAGYAYINSEKQPKWMTAKARTLFARFYTEEMTNPAGFPTSILAWIRATLPPGHAPSIKLDCLNKTIDSQRLEIRLMPAALGGWVLNVESQTTIQHPRFRAVPQLSARENEVLQWMTEGKRNSEIATILGISPRTVEKHVQSILESLRVENRASAIVMAMGMTAGSSEKPQFPG